MKLKTKMITSVVMTILVMSMLVVGVFAVKTASFDIGGSIVFNANGIEAIISAGTLNYDEAYQNISDKGNVMQEVVLSTDTSKDTSSKMSTWSGLKLQFNENGDDVVISFTVTNVSTRVDDYLLVSIATPTTNSNNIKITINSESSGLAPNIGEAPENRQTYTITFSVINKEINAKLDNFAIKVGLEQVKEASSYEKLEFTYSDSPLESEVKFKYAYTEDEMNSDTGPTEFKRGTGANLTIPAYVKNNDKVYTVTGIANAGFAFCTELKSVHLPNTIESIGSGAFGYCGSEDFEKNFVPSCEFSGIEDTGLEKINIPDSVTSIDGAAFFACNKLSSVTIGNGVTSIGDSAFYFCTGLESAIIGNSVINIGEGAFTSCLALNSITMGDSVKNIGAQAFQYCSSLTSITIPASMTSIGDQAFNRCHKLVEVYDLSSLNITKGFTENGEVGYYALNVYKSLDDTSKLSYENGYIFYKDIENHYLMGYNGTETDLILPTIDSYKIYKYAFYGCGELTSITMSDNVTSIGDYALYGCGNLNTITINRATPPELGSDAILLNENLVIKVPSANVDLYKETSGWSSYADNIQAIG